MRWSLLIGLIFIFACSTDIVPATHQNKTVEKEEVLSPSEGLKGLYCFKCHSYDRFRGNGNRFPHEKHRVFYHCNQCHRMKMHHFIETDTSLCKTCHSMGRFVYTGSGIKTFFDHASHAKRSSCEDCHPGIFIMKKGMDKVTMEDIYKGQFCGACHNGKRAFDAQNCTACHEMG